MRRQDEDHSQHLWIGGRKVFIGVVLTIVILLLIVVVSLSLGGGSSPVAFKAVWRRGNIETGYLVPTTDNIEVNTGGAPLKNRTLFIPR